MNNEFDGLEPGRVIMLVLLNGTYLTCTFNGWLDEYIHVRDPLRLYREPALEEGEAPRYVSEPFIVLSPQRNIYIPNDQLITIIPTLDEFAVASYHANVDWHIRVHDHMVENYEKHKKAQFAPSDESEPNEQSNTGCTDGSNTTIH